jgi:hypothetical protein
MKQVILSVPTFGFIVSTRAALAFGVALLVSNRFPPARRQQIGLALVAIGAATTIPAARALFRKRSFLDRDVKLIGTQRFPRKGDDGDYD